MNRVFCRLQGCMSDADMHFITVRLLGAGLRPMPTTTSLGFVARISLSSTRKPVEDDVGRFFPRTVVGSP